MTYQRSETGAVINPPTIPAREREIYSTMEREPGNTAKIEQLTREYDKERTAMADEEDRAERQEAEDQAAADAAARQTVTDREAATTADKP